MKFEKIAKDYYYMVLENDNISNIVLNCCCSLFQESQNKLSFRSFVLTEKDLNNLNITIINCDNFIAIGNVNNTKKIYHNSNKIIVEKINEKYKTYFNSNDKLSIILNTPYYLKHKSKTDNINPPSEYKKLFDMTYLELDKYLSKIKIENYSGNELKYNRLLSHESKGNAYRPIIIELENGKFIGKLTQRTNFTSYTPYVENILNINYKNNPVFNYKKFDSTKKNFYYSFEFYIGNFCILVMEKLEKIQRSDSIKILENLLPFIYENRNEFCHSDIKKENIMKKYKNYYLIDLDDISIMKEGTGFRRIISTPKITSQRNIPCITDVKYDIIELIRASDDLYYFDTEHELQDSYGEDSLNLLKLRKTWCGSSNRFFILLKVAENIKNISDNDKLLLLRLLKEIEKNEDTCTPLEIEVLNDLLKGMNNNDIYKKILSKK